MTTTGFGWLHGSLIFDFCFENNFFPSNERVKFIFVYFLLSSSILTDFDCSLQNFEVEYKAKKEARKRKGGPGGAPGGPDSETETSATPPPAKQRHPGEESRPRGFERGLFII